MKKHGFTLAETLITLTIIGVVAAMTIPNMIAKHQKREIEVGLQKTYAELSNWIKSAEADFGPFDSWDTNIALDNTKFDEKYIAPYMKLTRCTSKRKCFAKTNHPYQTEFYAPTATKEPGVVEGLLGRAYLLPDGRALVFTASAIMGWNPPGKQMTICADVNGPKGRSITGQDVHCFHINNFRDLLNHPRNTLGAGILNSNRDQSYLMENCYKDQHGKSCTILLQRNGWKFPDDYPIKF